MAAMNFSKMSTLRTILRSIRRNDGSSSSTSNSPTYMFIMEQYKKNSVTDAQLCHEQQELAFLAETYATYLEAGKKYKELYEEFHHPERSIEETARIVGFKLPQDPE
ncbi:hypothetical protein FHG87_000141 [Trinorchestia longiramus]|nr:hypothetical protein FHG87_000141 [Trinorchestia longiramus]